MPDLSPLIHAYRPRSPIIQGDGWVLSQGDFLAAALELAGRLPTGHTAVNLCADRLSFMLAFCATVLGGATNLLPANRQEQTLEALHRQYPGSVCLTDVPQPAWRGAVLQVGAPAGAGGAVPVASPVVRPDHPAAIAFTSGSTGSPRPHLKPWRSLAGTARRLARRFCSDAHPLIVATVPSQHMYGLEMTTMMALQGGCVLHDSHPFYPLDVAAALAEASAPAILVSTPVHLRTLQRAGCALPPLARVISATAPLDPVLAARFEACSGAPVEEIYGCTEAGSLATRRPVEGDTWQLLPDMRLVRQGSSVWVEGPQLPAATALEDRLEVLDPSHFRFLGRASDLLNVGGKRASLGGLNQALLAIDGVEDGVVFVPDPRPDRARPDRARPDRPAALVVSDLSERELAAGLVARGIDPVFVPRPIRRVPRVPRNETGKIHPAVLLELLGRHRD